KRITAALQPFEQIAEIIELAAGFRGAKGLIGDRVCFFTPAAFEQGDTQHHLGFEMSRIGRKNLTVKLDGFWKPAGLMQTPRCPEQRVVHGVVAPARRSETRDAIAPDACSLKNGICLTAKAEISTGIASTV